MRLATEPDTIVAAVPAKYPLKEGRVEVIESFGEGTRAQTNKFFYISCSIPAISECATERIISGSTDTNIEYIFQKQIFWYS